MRNPLRALWAEDEARSDPTISLSDWLNMFSFGGTTYLTGTGTLTQGTHEIGGDFRGYIEGAYKANGPVFACMLARQMLFSEARFQFRQIRGGRLGELFGTDALAPLEKPWPNATTGDLLARAMQYADLAGNFYAVRQGNRIRTPRPDWMTIVLGSETDAEHPAEALDAEVIGYLYHPGGRHSESEPHVLLPEQVAHFAPIPDPSFQQRGMSWLTPVINEVMGDHSMTTHKRKFFENGATVNLIVTLDPEVEGEQFDSWVRRFREGHEGVANAYKTLFFGGGADAKPVGSDLKQVEFKVTQGHGETRIAAAARMPPIVVGFSEGLEAATYSNYGQARRACADGTLRPLWRNFCGSMESIIPPPAGSQLWYDPRDIPFLQEDEKDAAAIQVVNAQTIRTLVDGGYTPESVVQAVLSGDMKRLVHTGLFSVQLQAPGTQQPSPSPSPASSGTNDVERVLALLTRN